MPIVRDNEPKDRSKRHGMWALALGVCVLLPIGVAAWSFLRPVEVRLWGHGAGFGRLNWTSPDPEVSWSSDGTWALRIDNEHSFCVWWW